MTFRPRLDLTGLSLDVALYWSYAWDQPITRLFLWLAASGVICGSTWCVAHRRIVEFWSWRAGFSVFIGVMLWFACAAADSNLLAPVVFISCGIQTGEWRAVLLLGVLPICVAAIFVFLVLHSQRTWRQFAWQSSRQR